MIRDLTKKQFFAWVEQLVLKILDQSLISYLSKFNWDTVRVHSVMNNCQLVTEEGIVIKLGFSKLGDNLLKSYNIIAIVSTKFENHTPTHRRTIHFDRPLKNVHFVRLFIWNSLNFCEKPLINSHLRLHWH
jgi:hypothetical protein